MKQLSLTSRKISGVFTPLTQKKEGGAIVINNQTCPKYYQKFILLFVLFYTWFLCPLCSIRADAASEKAYLYFFTVDGEEIEELEKKVSEKRGYTFLNPDPYKYLPVEEDGNNPAYPELYDQITGIEWEEKDEEGNHIATYKEGDTFDWSAGDHFFYVKSDNPILTGENTMDLTWEERVHLYFYNVNGDELYSLEQDIGPKDEYTFPDPEQYAYRFEENAESEGDDVSSDTLSGKGIYWYCMDEKEKEYLFADNDKAKFRPGTYEFYAVTDDPVQVSFYYPIDYDTYYVADDMAGAVYDTIETKVGETIRLKKSLGAILWESTFQGWEDEETGEQYDGGTSYRIMQNRDLNLFAVYEYDEDWDPNAVDQNTGEQVGEKEEINIADLDKIEEAAGAGYDVAIDAEGILRRTGNRVKINNDVQITGIPGTIQRQKSLSSLKPGGDPNNPEDYRKDKYGNKMEESKLPAEINNVLRQDDSAMYMDVYGNSFVYYPSLTRKNNMLLAYDRLTLGKTDSWVKNTLNWDAEMIHRFEAVEFALLNGKYPQEGEELVPGIVWKNSYMSKKAFDALKVYKPLWQGWYSEYTDGLLDKYKEPSGDITVGSITNPVTNLFGMTAYAASKEKNPMGDASQVGARIITSQDLEDIKFKPQYYDPTKIYSFSSYSFASLEGLTGEQISILTTIFNNLVEYGFSEAAAAGVCGNLWQESHFKIDAYNPKGGYYGMIQWGGSRAETLKKLAASMGSTWDDVDVQIAMIQQELDQGFLTRLNSYLKRYGSTMQTVTDVDAATEAWAAMFEGCVCVYNGKTHSAHNSQCAMAANGKSYQHLSTRKEYGRRVLAAMQHTGSGGGGSFAGMSNAEILSSIFGAPDVRSIMAKFNYQFSAVERYLTTIQFTDYQGKKRSVRCNERIAEDLMNALNEISAAGFPIQDVYCYSGRPSTSGSSWSFHALGLAIDINAASSNTKSMGWAHNPQFYKSDYSNDEIRQNYQPGIDPYAVRLQEYYILKSHGFLWGRDFSTRPDIMHFVVGEVGQDGKNAWISQLCEGVQ